ncbi:IS110 family transposase [Inquilinus limosus]|uniref:IS110 family transposase n=1 Tax=Inquilinus limosus TaxID=171674 RepID=UPI003F17BA09
MVEITRIGMDTSKSVFQLHGVDAAEQVVLRKKLRRQDLLRFFAKLPPCRVALEACGGSHHWARELQALGHWVELIPPQYVKPYVARGKHDAADAEAICEAMSRPKVRQRLVPVKSAEAQAALMLAGLRDRLVRQRTQLVNTIRGYAAEFGLVAAKGPAKIAALLRRIADDPAVPELARAAFAELAAEHARLEARIKEAEAKLMAWHRQDEPSRRLAEIPSVGPIGACFLVLKAPDPQRFRSGRDFAASLGLTPKNHSTAGKQRLGVITRAGDEALRSLLVVGATSVIRQVRRGTSRWAPPWLLDLIARKPPKLAAVALANKVARIAWKLMVSGERYRPQPAATLGA